MYPLLMWADPRTCIQTDLVDCWIWRQGGPHPVAPTFNTSLRTHLGTTFMSPDAIAGDRFCSTSCSSLMTDVCHGRDIVWLELNRTPPPPSPTVLCLSSGSFPHRAWSQSHQDRDSLVLGVKWIGLSRDKINLLHSEKQRCTLMLNSASGWTDSLWIPGLAVGHRTNMEVECIVKWWDA